MSAEILRLIETVDPHDTAKLDEIDARVKDFIHPDPNMNWADWIDCFNVNGKNHLLYTRSRDALKAIRPEGWFFDIENIANRTKRFKFACIPAYPAKCIELDGSAAATEELAELHAIIQAIEFERENSKVPP